MDTLSNWFGFGASTIEEDQNSWYVWEKKATPRTL